MNDAEVVRSGFFKREISFVSPYSFEECIKILRMAERVPRLFNQPSPLFFRFVSDDEICLTLSTKSTEWHFLSAALIRQGSKTRVTTTNDSMALAAGGALLLLVLVIYLYPHLVMLLVFFLRCWCLFAVLFL
jgi:hypothetical protein